MPEYSELGKRMKEYYEAVPKARLMRRCPVICRIDGKTFHSFTKGFEKPFDHILMQTMQDTMKHLCSGIQGSVLGYTQSDEISLLLIDYKTLVSQALFDYEVQKMCSVIASMATCAFNKLFYKSVSDFLCMTYRSNQLMENRSLIEAYQAAFNEGAMFDCRVFNIPENDVVNYFYWRQQDASRNSVQMAGRAFFSHGDLHNKSCSEIQDMLMDQFHVNWNDYSVPEKRGSCCLKEIVKDGDVVRRKWMIDDNIPVFKNEGRNYISRFLPGY